MANLTAAALANRNKKHFLGVPAPPRYVAGVGIEGKLHKKLFTVLFAIKYNRFISKYN